MKEDSQETSPAIVERRIQSEFNWLPYSSSVAEIFTLAFGEEKGNNRKHRHYHIIDIAVKSIW